MPDVFALEKLIIYPYWKQDSHDISNCEKTETSEILQKVSVGNYVEALKDEESQKAFTFISDSRPNTSSIHEFCKQNFLAYLEAGDKQAEEVLFGIGVSCLQLFVQNNFCGPLVGPPVHTLIPSLIPSDKDETETRKCALKELLIDIDEIYTMIAQPELLIIARILFCDLQKNLRSFVTVDWWCFRYCIVHQKISDESSESLYNVMVRSLEEVEKSKIISERERDICALFYLEAGHVYLFYYDVKNAKECMNKALNVLGMELSLTGALGARTKWQENKVAQLVAKVSYTNKHLTGEEQKGSILLPTDLPKDVILVDDTRLSRIKFVEDDEDIIPNLRPLEQMVLFGQFILLRKSQAQDEQLTEQSKAYLISILQFPKNWSLQLSALLIRSKIESCETRAMERSLVQLEELVKSVEVEEPSRFERLKLIYSSSLLTHWNVRKELANMLIRLGCVKTALEIFEKLHLWEDVIVCYNELQMRQRSAEIIRELLLKEETPKLWCLLGDATDEINYYYKAWELSKHKSSRAQKCLGNYYYVRKDYSKAIKHFDISLDLNKLQYPVCLRLAYCALQTGMWEKCAKAYKRCSILEPDNFECWNNMSQAYIRMGHNYQAWKSLQEALRCRTDNWRLWDNYMLVSTSLGYMTQALYAYNRILQYKEKHVDTEILGRIVYAILDDKQDPDGKPLKVLYKKCLELVSRLSREVSTHPELWFLYAELTYSNPEGNHETKHTSMQHYRKAVAAETQKSGWEKNVDVIQSVIMKALRLIDVVKEVTDLTDSKASLSQLVSVRSLIRNIVILIQNNQTNINSNEITNSIKDSFHILENELTFLTNLIELKK